MTCIFPTPPPERDSGDHGADRTEGGATAPLDRHPAVPEEEATGEEDGENVRGAAPVEVSAGEATTGRHRQRKGAMQTVYGLTAARPAGLTMNRTGEPSPAIPTAAPYRITVRNGLPPIKARRTKGRDFSPKFFRCSGSCRRMCFSPFFHC